MDNDLKKQILDIVKAARLAREEALKPDGLGNYFAYGFATASLDQIYRLVKEA